jgi:hypothetical protein
MARSSTSRTRKGSVEVDEYVAAVPEGRRGMVSLLRRLCLEHLVGFTEVMAHGMPGYERDNEMEVGFANQRQYVSLYILRKAVLDVHRDRFAGLSLGKGCVRFRRPEQLDEAVITSVLRATAASRGPIC